MKLLHSSSAVIALLFGLLTGCHHAPEPDTATPLYFASPETSVAVINLLTSRSDWETLGRYYDLAGTGLSRADVSEEAFYIRKPPYSPAQPAGVGRFRELFPSSFSFESADPGEAPDIIVVTAGVAIDQGGGPPQHVKTTFRLRQSKSGYQLVPATRS